MNEKMVIQARLHDLGSFVVRRLLPVAQRRTVGPFIFFDHMGPADFPPGEAVNVRPHPHIGLATLTYLYSGELLHRDSLGTSQTILPGDVNWMIAGRGITHSERVSDQVRASGQHMEGLQLWIALPTDAEEMAPEFHHYAAAQLPRLTQAGAQITVIAGSAFGRNSPVKCLSPMVYLDIRLEPGAVLDLPAEISEKAIYLMEGELSANDDKIVVTEMSVWMDSAPVRLVAESATHLVMIGGQALTEPRFMFWNFVSSRPDRLEQAKRDWQTGQFAKVPGDAIEFIPLPE